ncbi:MAG TPA: caspase family protein, partial [Steroidobacteraceae bacterium]|nr:caspase family protein [Steroidobacteraceae bacterium]
MSIIGRCTRGSLLSACVIALVQAAGAGTQNSREVEIRSRIAAASLEDAIVVDCQLPGTLQKLGGMRTYLTPGKLLRLSAVDCRSRGGEYTMGDLSSGTLSIKRWLPLAEQGDAEAQYYVARIYANGMGGVPVDYARAVTWYQKAAKQQYQSALQELGYMYEQGLGVERDALQALNLQRQAAGLGEELDYAWKITEAKEEAARQVAALTDQLEQSNTEIETLRAQVTDTNDALFRSRADLGRSETALLDLKEQLKAANEKAGAADTSRVQELQRALTVKEQALAQARTQVDTLTAQARQQQQDLNDRLASTQLSSHALSELLANEEEKNRSLLAQAAQMEQRLTRSQQELSDLRDQYRAEVDQWAAQRSEFARAAEKNKDAGAVLVTAAERELERQKLRVASLERSLADARSASKKDEGAASRELKELQSRYDEQRQKVEAQRTELAALRSKSDQERRALLEQINDQAASRVAELQAKERRIASLSTESDKLRSDLERLRAQGERDGSASAKAVSDAREAKRMALAQVVEAQERLERLKTDRTTEVRKLVAARETLARELQSTEQKNAQQVALLQQDLDDRDKDIEAKDVEIARLGQRLTDQKKRYEAMLAQAPAVAPGVAKVGATASTARGDAKSNMKAYLDTVPQGNFHALVIGNSDYSYMGSLDTPTQDARELAQILEDRYDFKVRLLTNVKTDEIMLALHAESEELTEDDSLLIYYAGQGDASQGPNRALWLGVDYNPVKQTGSFIEADNIRAKIKQMKAKHVLLVVDSCFSPAITSRNSMAIGRTLDDKRLKAQLNRRARMVLTSGQVPPMPDNVGDRSHSAFARQLLQILRQNDTVLSGEVLSYKLTENLQQSAQK